MALLAILGLQSNMKTILDLLTEISKFNFDLKAELGLEGNIPDGPPACLEKLEILSPPPPTRAGVWADMKRVWSMCICN